MGTSPYKSEIDLINNTIFFLFWKCLIQLGSAIGVRFDYTFTIFEPMNQWIMLIVNIIMKQNKRILFTNIS